jgi:hypothetical protein
MGERAQCDSDGDGDKTRARDHFVSTRRVKEGRDGLLAVPVLLPHISFSSIIMSSVKDKMKQKRISQFFSKTRSDPEESEGASTEESTYDRNCMVIDQEDEDEDEVGTSSKKDKYTSPEDSTLPPISRLPDIFLDIVSRLSEVKTLAEHIKGRTLRVATMCSGTESPLLALNLISRAMTEKYGTTIDVEHVFSCEIVPFKQAYIERNFQPPLLFRDVCELGDDYAYAA